MIAPRARQALNHVSRRSAARRTFSTTPARSQEQRVIFSGIQPTGVPHLGNYLGALRQWKKLQDSAEPDARLLYSLVDLHAITVRQNPAQLRKWRQESLATLLAIGIDPSRSIVFHQSDVSAHSELMWILSCIASVGHLSRMTQWKSKMVLPGNAKPLTTPVQLGLFSYPVLQAADILVHKATHVPVGEDQSQHLEFARSCAASFNHQYSEVLVEPQTILSPAKRVMSLSSPSKKMSKSDANEKSRILITDSKETIELKLKAATTDSVNGVVYDPQSRPALANLIDIMHHLQDDQTMSQEDLVGDITSKAALKSKAAEIIDQHMEPIREKFQELMANPKYLVEVAEEGAKAAMINAEMTMIEVREAVGFGPPV